MVEVRNLRGAVIASGENLISICEHAQNLTEADLTKANLTEADLTKANLTEANLTKANLTKADLTKANLTEANLRWANLRWANLTKANLRWADLRWANLTKANLTEANLTKADLTKADLTKADLTEADLRWANLRWANLTEANLTEANLPDYQICPETGPFMGFKKISSGVATLKIPDDAERVSSLVGRKCRASKVEVIEIEGDATEGHSLYDKDFIYKVGNPVSVNSFDSDIRNECAEGIHFFITKKEAEAFSL